MTAEEAEQAELPLPRPGDVVGKYRLLRPIGGGGMGLVFEALHVRLRQHVAIKFMQPKLVGTAEAVARFEREGRAASSLTSPYTVRIFDVDVTKNGIPYIVSEFLLGRDLRAELEERSQLPLAEAVNCVIQVCAAMAEAHAHGIIHRDLKPSNLFLADTPTGRVVKVVDFGISKVSTEEELDLTTTGVMLGSPRYMSPEQAQAKPADRRADVWSLGVVLFRALTGTYPFEGDSPLAMALATLSEKPREVRELLPEAPPELASALAKAIERDLSQRFDTMRDFAEALAPLASPEMAALAVSLTRDVAVPSQRTSDRDLRRASGVSARVSQVDTETEERVGDLILPIDVEPTEHMAKPSPFSIDTSGIRAAAIVAPAPPRSKRPLAVGAIVALAVGVGVVIALSRPGGSADREPAASARATVDDPTLTANVVAAPTASTTTALPASAATSARAATSAPASGRSGTPASTEHRRAPPPVVTPPTATHKNPSYL